MNTVRKIMYTIALFAVVVVAGCAGSSYQIQAFDVIEQGSNESKKGVQAMYISLTESNAKDTAVLIENVGKGVYDTAKQGGLDDVKAAAQQKKVVELLTKNLSNIAEQRRRIDKTYAAVIDNLDYINQVCGEGRKFVVYRMNAEQQWKDYILQVSKAKIQSTSDATETLNTGE